jgi:hypothetical protein
MTNTNLSTDLRLLHNRKAIELNSLSNLNAYDLRSAQIKINWKYEVIVEALTGLHDMGVAHSCNLSELVANFEAIAPSQR